VDNNSTDGTSEFLLDLSNRHPFIKVVLNENNLGVGIGRNAGFAKANREFIVALDDDTAISVGDIRRVPDLFYGLPDTGILAFRVVHQVSGELQNPHGDLPCPVSNHHGAGFAFRREIFQKLGGISEESDYGADELDFAIRVHAAGWKIRYTPEITVFHNSKFRDLAQEAWKHERWIYNHVRVFYSYFPHRMAAVHSCRFVLPLLWHGFKQFGFTSIRSQLDAAVNGRLGGLRNHRPIPLSTVSHYADKCLRPETGNVPLLLKLLRKLTLNRAANTKK
jgi:GT2 family glycosyltransferase